jgi:hypothetical protein
MLEALYGREQLRPYVEALARNHDFKMPPQLAKGSGSGALADYWAAKA